MGVEGVGFMRGFRSAKSQTRPSSGTGLTTSPQSGIKSPFPGPYFALALTGTRGLLVQIKEIEKDDCPPSEGWWLGSRSDSGSRVYGVEFSKGFRVLVLG